MSGKLLRDLGEQGRRGCKVESGIARVQAIGERPINRIVTEVSAQIGNSSPKFLPVRVARLRWKRAKEF